MEYHNKYENKNKTLKGEKKEFTNRLGCLTNGRFMPFIL